MPLLGSGPLSSVAYATEKILLVLNLGIPALLRLAWKGGVATASS
jgi:hypothetical protein